MHRLPFFELEAGLDHIRQSPSDRGTVDLIVRRPAVDEREVLEVGELDLVTGLVGDRWGASVSSNGDGPTYPDTQLTIMNSRSIALFAQDLDHWALAGDQFYLDLDISTGNLPTGTQLLLGSAIIEVTDQPHTGCSKFSSRFGMEALRLTRTDEGKRLRLRGMYAKVIRGGSVAQGDLVQKLEE